MASVIIEKVITEYILDADKFKAGADQVMASGKKLVANAGKMGETIGKGFQMFKGLAVGATVASLPMIGLAKTALDSAVAYDTLQRSLNAIVGSAQRTGQILAFVQKLALPSIYTQAQLGEASKTLEAFGLNTERFLPIAEKLGTVFGGTTESLDSFITSLGYLKSGRFGEAFESLARGGISRTALMGEGLKFDKGGSYLGSVDQALTAVEKLVNQKFGQLSKEMASGAGAGLASFSDAWNIAMIKIGTVMLKYVVPIVQTLANALNNLSSSGVLDKLTDGLMKMFDTKSIGDALISTLAGIMAGLQIIPQFVRDLQQSFATNFDNIIGKVRNLAVSLGTIFIAGQITQGVVAFIKVLQMLRSSIIATAIAEGVLEASVTGGASLVKTIAGMLAGMVAIGAVSYGIASQLDNMVGDVGSITSEMPSLQDFATKKAELEKIMKAGATGGGVADSAGAVAGAGGGAGGGGKDEYKALNDAQLQANLRVQASEREVARKRKLYDQAFATAKLYPDREDVQTKLEEAQKLLQVAQKDLADAKKARLDADQKLREFKPGGAGAGTAGGALADAGQAETGGFKDSLMKIATSSRETADNTKKQLDINNKVLGGGTLASRGLSRQEMADMAGGRRSGSKEIKSILVELGYAIERNMSRNTATAFGNNVSRREV